MSAMFASKLKTWLRLITKILPELLKLKNVQEKMKIVNVTKVI